jgi:large subunit ribosomal protein L21
MYAVIETGGKQYRVEVGTELEVELLDANAGDSVDVARVLLVADGDVAAIGRPLVENASVAAEVVRRERGEKLVSFKYRPKARSRVKKGHRQELMVLRINDIVLDGKSAAGEKAEADKARRAEREKLEETARRQAAADAALAAKLAADKPKAETKSDTKRDAGRSRVAKGAGGTTATPRSRATGSKAGSKSTDTPEASEKPKRSRSAPKKES